MNSDTYTRLINDDEIADLPDLHEVAEAGRATGRVKIAAVLKSPTTPHALLIFATPPAEMAEAIAEETGDDSGPYVSAVAVTFCSDGTAGGSAIPAVCLQSASEARNEYGGPLFVRDTAHRAGMPYGKTLERMSAEFERLAGATRNYG